MALLLFKAFAKPKEGSRWITVHPGGPGSEGQAVLIQPAGDGSYHVVGGAGGKLNYLRLRGVKSEAQYKEQARQRVTSAKEAEQRQKETDRAAGLDKSKRAAREVLKASLGDQRAKFVARAAEIMGWKQSDMTFPQAGHEGLTPAQRKRAEAQFARQILQRARAAAGHQRQRLVMDAEARSAGGLAEVPLTTANAADLTVQDLDPIAPATSGLGYAPHFAEVARERGATAADIAAEAEAAKPAKAAKPATETTPEAIGQNVEAIRDPGPQLDTSSIVPAQQAVELLKALKELENTERTARQKEKQIAAAKVAPEPRAYILEAGRPVADAAVMQRIETDLRTVRTRAFLSEMQHAEEGGDPVPLGRYLATGAYNAINGVALTVGGTGMVDRMAADVLGPAASAQVLARRLRADLSTEEFGRLQAAMGEYHVEHYMELSDDALREARDLHEAAHEVEIGEAASGSDLQVAQELNAKRRDLIVKANATLGTALGEMEANAALVKALAEPARDTVELSLEKLSLEHAITQVRAIGLDRGDYSLERIGPSTILTIKASGLDKLAKPIDRAELERVKGSLDIIAGRHDEQGWLPEGVARRPDLAMNVPPGVAPRLAKPFQVDGGDVAGAVRSYIGGRAADGDAPADIIAGLLSSDTIRASGDGEALLAALNEIAPQADAAGRSVRVEQYADRFDTLADEFTERTYGGARTPITKQQFPIDQTAVEALHRALAATPEATLAWKPVGDLTPEDQGALRGVYLREYGAADPEAQRLAERLAKMDMEQPDKMSEGMFGSQIDPMWTEWKAKRDDLASKVGAASQTWHRYVQVMGSPTAAYEAMQDIAAGKAVHDFAATYNTLHADKPLAIGRLPIRHDIEHLDALDPASRDKRIAERAALIDTLRKRVAGKYSSGSVTDEAAKWRAAEEAAEQSQISMFGAEAEPKTGDKPLEPGQRYTIGHAAERQIAGMMPIVGKQFQAGEKVAIWAPAMDGTYIARQRAVKLIQHNKRTELGLGTGSGKTSIALSAFADLKSKGHAKRGLFIVPSAVQGQFHGEALTVLEPGKFTWHNTPGATREQRIAGYKDQTSDFAVVTHQAFRDDMLHLASQREKTSPGAIATKLGKMSVLERRDYMRDLMKAEGIDTDYITVDEGHNLLNRKGKANSQMANVIDGVTGAVPYYVNMTADTVKNSVDEVYSVLEKMDPDRWNDRASFMRRYGVDFKAAQAELTREMAPYLYTAQIDPGVHLDSKEISVPMGDAETKELARIEGAVSRARLARMQGKVDIPALKELSPDAFAAGADENKVAADLMASLGITADTATMKAINGPAKLDAVATYASERRGKPGVVFARSLKTVHAVRDRLQAQGLTVMSMTGADSAATKAERIRAFRRGEADVLVSSDAGAVGTNLQTGQWLVQMDTSQTAMLHAQRRGRIFRCGQKHDVETADMVADHPAERRARRRLAAKYDLRQVMQSPLEGLDDTGLAGVLNRMRAGTGTAQPDHIPAAPEEIARGQENREGEQLEMVA